MPRNQSLAAEWTVGLEEAESIRDSVRQVAASRVRDWNAGVVLDLVGRCYEASLDPGMWSGFLEKLSDAVHGSQSDIVLMDFDAGDGNFNFFSRFDPDYIRSFHDYYVTVNPALYAERVFQTGVSDHWKPCAPTRCCEVRSSTKTG